MLAQNFVGEFQTVFHGGLDAVPFGCLVYVDPEQWANAINHAFKFQQGFAGIGQLRSSRISRNGLRQVTFYFAQALQYRVEIVRS